MITLRVCGKWDIHVHNVADTGKRVQYGQDPFNQYFDAANITKRIVPISRFTWCWWQAVKYIKANYDISSVAELFGGVGRTAVIIQNELMPLYHIIVDYDVVQYEHLSTLRHDYNVHVMHGDAFEVNSKYLRADFVALDYTVTVHRLLNDIGNMSALLRRIASENPDVIELTDSAISKLHLHYNTYSYNGFTPANNNDYFVVLDMVMRDMIGYEVKFVSYYNAGMACVVLGAEGSSSDFIVVNDNNVPESRKCLEVAYSDN